MTLAGSERDAAERLKLNFAHPSTAMPAAQPFVRVLFDEDNGDGFHHLEAMCSIERRRALGVQPLAMPSKSRRAPQATTEREALKADLDANLDAISRIEGQAGPTLAKDIAKAKSFQAAYSLGKARQAAILRRRGHRKGLLQLLQCESHRDDPCEVNARSLLYVEMMLRISANLAAIEGSDWEAVSTWFERRLPVLAAQIGYDRLHDDFDQYRTEAALALAGRVQGGADSFIVEPRPHTIAQALQLTIDHLRYAEANRCGLAAIDTPTKKDRDRERKERERRTKGMVPQSARTKTATLKALAAQHGCSLRTLQRRQEDGTLEAYLAERSGSVAKVSAA